jgi:hypothetical protein
VATTTITTTTATAAVAPTATATVVNEVNSDSYDPEEDIMYSV